MGSFVEVAARFAAENEKLDEAHYNVMDTEVGKLYVPRNSVSIGDKIGLGLRKFLWMDGVQVFGIRPAA